MYEVTFELENITPLFMHGADQGTAEFRAASVKGVMRWWFRALAGNYFGDNIPGLKKAECRIFGCAGSGEAKRSSVIIECSHRTSNKQEKPKSGYERYFWFSQIGKFAKGAIPRGRVLKLRLKSHDEVALRLAVLSLWPALHLGGFGSRARRLGGSLFPVSEPEGNIKIDINFLPPENGNIAGFYRDILGNKLLSKFEAALKELGFDLEEADFEGLPKYPVLSRRYSGVFVGKLHDSADEAISEVGEWYLGEHRRNKFEGGFRFKEADRGLLSRIYRKYNDIRESGRRNENITISVPVRREWRPFFGLPIQMYKEFSYGEFVQLTINYTGYNSNSNSNINKVSRRASGVLLTINKVRQQGFTKYYHVITVFASEYLPEYRGYIGYNGGIKKRVRRGSIPLAGVQGSILQDGMIRSKYISFLNELFSSLQKEFKLVYGSLEGLK
ncbi:type III-B CRISPR module RAMP protein Cmr1 [Pyrococcus kukulkanii]|uniref:type III-B CRISPR module RAMP protein Cmr1 n=1 Tax=Pyrococcus kukulkanii TaxID=1609559 RepID=UPI0008365B70|nr:type III-B CRISPR module RAMP protein Cmr1 [Pyrococcus kukulkanii]